MRDGQTPHGGRPRRIALPRAGLGILIAVATGLLSPATTIAAGVGTWKVVAHMQTPRRYFAASTGQNGLIYAIAGSNYSTGDLSSVEAFNPTTNRWAPAAPLPVPEYGLCSAVGVAGKIYAIGGDNGGSGVIAYSTRKNTWFTEASLPTPVVFGACSRGADGDIYVFDTASTRHVYQYNPNTNTWLTEASLFPNLRYSPAAVLGPDKLIYVALGYNFNGGVLELDIYNPATDTWTVGSAPPSGVSCGGSCAATAIIGPNGKMYVSGGGNAMGAYSFTAHTWTTLAGAPGVDGQLAASSGSSAHLYFIGGANLKTFYPQTATYRFTP
jgi:N-acetylneuraminic acid mutarotase